MSKAVVCFGDSITNGAGIPISYPQLMAFLLGPTWSTVNIGVVGWHTASMLAAYNAGTKGQGFNVVAVLGGVNDALGGDDPVTITIPNLQAIYDGCLADPSCIPVLVTITPCSTGPGWSAAAQTKIETINTAIRAYATAHSVPLYEAYVDMAEPGFPTQLATIFSADGLHHNQAGAQRLADKISALILAALGP
jgi:lysophospholipase L1-like esterase